MLTPEQIDKLPKRVADHIQVLNSTIAALQESIDAYGGKATNIYYNVLAQDQRCYIPYGETIYFDLPNEHKISARIDMGLLYINSWHGKINIQPYAANACYIKPVSRFEE